MTDAPVIAPRLVALSIATLPSGAQVIVDGRAAGLAPLTLLVAPGTHEVRLARARYAPARLGADAPGQLNVQLQRPAARLRVTSQPPGAVVRVDGEPAGFTPLELTAAAYESYLVDAQLDGRTAHRNLYLKPPLGVVELDLR